MKAEPNQEWIYRFNIVHVVQKIIYDGESSYETPWRVKFYDGSYGLLLTSDHEPYTRNWQFLSWVTPCQRCNDFCAQKCTK